MTLQPIPNQPGLWQNPDWTPGTPGTFVLLIGASRYEHLEGGSGPVAPNSYGMKQLAVSAWTAYALFEWFRTTYQYASAPLAQCWLLLSPTDDERTQIGTYLAGQNGPDVLAHRQPATFAAQEEAIALWDATLRDLPRQAAEASRSFFFFSGHGLEIHKSHQVLLPADYLRLPNTHNRALSIRGLADAMATLPVCDQFFFVDACRNTHADLAALDIKGNSVLTVTSGTAVNPACNSIILYATASGMPALQYSSPTDGYSLFGQSLLDGLQSRQGFIPACAPPPCSVQLAHLQKFLNQRYNQLLIEANWPTKQYIKFGSEPLDVFSVITHVPPPTAAPAFVPSVAGQEAKQFTHRFAVIETIPGVGQPFRVSVEALPGVDFGWPPVRDYNTHKLMGHEYVTDFWESARLYDRYSHLLLKKKTVVLERVERTNSSALATGYRVTFSVGLPPGRYWLELTDRPTHRGLLLTDRQTTYLVPLTTDREVIGYGRQPRFQVDFSATPDGQVADLQADLGMANRNDVDDNNRLERVRLLWEKYQTVDVASAAETVDMQSLRDALQNKMASPFAAMVGAMVLVQARRYDLAEGDWLWNLANWFPNLSDSLVLRNQWLLQTNAPDATAELTKNLLELPRRGMPLTGEAFSLALSQLDRLLTINALKPGQRTQLKKLQARLHESLRYFRPGGLFVVFAGKPGSFTPQSLGY